MVAICLQTEAELPHWPCTARSHPNLNQSFSMTDMQGRQVGQQVTDPVKNLVANRKRLESQVKAAQEVGRQVSGETWSCTGETTHTPSCKHASMHAHICTCIHMYIRTHKHAQARMSHIYTCVGDYIYPFLLSVNHFLTQSSSIQQLLTSRFTFHPQFSNHHSLIDHLFHLPPCPFRSQTRLPEEMTKDCTT